MELELREISVYYDKVEALNNISIGVDEGEIVSLLGANGAGKTTVLRVVSGLIRLTTGEIWYREQRIDDRGPQHIVRLGIIQVPEGRRLFPNMSVCENLLMGGFLRKNKGEIKRSLEQTYMHFPVLEERENQRAGSLSGGEQQMLAIARSLMAKPKLLLLDEPSMGLSPLMVAEISKVIKNIHSDGIPILLVEQNSRLAFKLSQRAYVMQTGKMVLQGAIVDLENNEYVKKAYLGG